MAIAADCKSALIRVRWFESIYLHILTFSIAVVHVVLVHVAGVRIPEGQQKLKGC